jgi:hypothetical protein
MGATEIVAIAPEAVLAADQLGRDARWLLAAADGYHVHHPHERLVFNGAITRWLREQGVGWIDVDVDVEAALRTLDQHSPRLVIEASPLAIAVVASPADVIAVLHPGGRVEDERIDEGVRDELRQVLEREWASHIGSMACD